MRRSLCAYLQDILDAAAAIHTFSDGLQFETFESVDLVRSAVERKFEIIGEALRQVSRHFPGSVASVPDLRDVINHRNHIAHGYFEVDAQVLWSTMHGDLIQLEQEIERIKSVHCA